MSNKLQVLDRIIQLEDKFEEESSKLIPSKVIHEIEKEYGQFGIDVASIYYSNNKDSDQEICPTCAEKAKKLIEKIQLSSRVGDSISNEELDSCYDILIKKYHIDTEIQEFLKLLYSNVKEDWINSKKIITMCVIRFLAKQEFKNDRQESFS